MADVGGACWLILTVFRYTLNASTCIQSIPVVAQWLCLRIGHKKTQKWWLRVIVFWSSSLAFELKCKVKVGSSGIYIDFWNKLLRDGNKEPYLLEKNVLLAKVAPLE